MTPDSSTFTFDDGATTEVSLYRGSPAVVITPALGVPGRYYTPLAEALAGAGLGAVVFDPRGQGTSSQRPGRAEFGYRQLTDDLAAIVEWTGRSTGGEVIPLGHSLGGHLIALLAASRPGLVSRAMMVAAGSPHAPNLSASQRLSLRLFPAALSASRLLGYFPGDRLGFGGRQPLTLMREWGRFALHGELAPDGRSPAWPVSLSLLSVSIGGDALAPPSAVEALARLVTPGTVTRLHLDAELGPEERHHFRWARRPEVVVSHAVRWVGSHGQPLPRVG